MFFWEDAEGENDLRHLSNDIYVPHKYVFNRNANIFKRKLAKTALEYFLEKKEVIIVYGA